jgi:hypothetical protein
MADAVFLLQTHFGESPGVFFRYEDGVESEAAAAPGLWSYPALTHAFEEPWTRGGVVVADV